MPIEFIADWSTMQGQIKAGGQAVSGMTMAEAEAALGTQSVITQGGNTLHVYNPGTQAPVKPPLQFPSVNTPMDAYWEYVNQGGTTSPSGAATSGSATVNNSNLTLTQTAGGATGVAGLLSMNLPTAAAAIAPLAGFAIGAGLYYSNPSLWEKISRALLPFCYDDTELLPVAVDENGVTYFPKDAIDAVSSTLIESEELSAKSDSDSLSEYINPYPFPVTRGNHVWVTHTSQTADNRYTIVESDSIVNIVSYGSMSSRYVTIGLRSDKPFKVVYYSSASPDGKPPIGTPYEDATYRDDGDKPYYGYNLFDMEPCYPPKSVFITQSMNIQQVTEFDIATVYGISPTPPLGTVSWVGTKYPASVVPLNVFSRYSDPDKLNPEFLPFYPVTTPVGDPGVSVDPATTPDITVNPDPNPAVNPWISPNPSPGTYPDGVPQSNPAELPGNVPDYTPNLDPEADPSQQPSPEPAPEPDPSPDEGSSGNSPTPAIPVFPALPSAAAGLLHVYNPTQGQIDSFGRWLWTTFSGDIIDTVSKLFNNPMDAVIGLHELYATPAVSGSSTIRAGYLDSGVSSNLVGSRYTSINCGSVVVPEYYENYLDYSPYTKCFVYLPFVGIVPVSADDIVGNAVNIKYNIDSYNGCCIAIITVARAGYSSTVYQFEGNCGVEVPITSGYQSTLMGGLLGIAGTAISGSPHVGLAASSLGRANLGKNEVSHSGSFGSSYGAMGAKIPYIIVKRPTQKSVVNYNDEYGFPAHKRVRIGDCSGYLRAREVHVVSPTATDEEKERIEEMLKEGVFVK